MDFSKKCYKKLSEVPYGKVTTYAELARAAGNPRAVRAVGNAMNKNPFAPKVPCHRVIKSNGKVGNFAHGPKKKIEMLKAEGIEVIKERVDLSKFMYKF